MKKLTIEKEKELKELSNKYFWEQKAIEIYLFILIVLGIIAALYISGSIMLMLDPTIEEGILLAGLLGLLILALSGTLVALVSFMIYKLIEAWIESNKEKAEQRAKKELGFKLDEWEAY